jgi:hypothetical protein
MKQTTEPLGRLARRCRAAASYAENVTCSVMEEPPRGSITYIYRVTARAYQAGDRCYIPTTRG